MKIKDLIIKGCRKIYRKTFKPEFIDPACEFDRSISNKYIYDLLVSDKPCMICRYGTTEIGIVTNYLSVHSKESRIKKYIKYITGFQGSIIKTIQRDISEKTAVIIFFLSLSQLC